MMGGGEDTIGGHRKRVVLCHSTPFADNIEGLSAIFGIYHKYQPVLVAVECKPSAQWPLVFDGPKHGNAFSFIEYIGHIIN
jgi:hypothetical protein